MPTVMQDPAQPALIDEAQQGMGGRLVPVSERTLPLRAVALRAEAAGGVARVVLEQRFANPWPDPLHVTYRMPLPADGAVAGYAFRVGGRRITGEVDRKARARQRFEEAVVSGRTAALLDQERDSLFTQELGNVPPGAEVVAELTIDQPLAWIEDAGAWEWRFPTSAAPRYLGAPGRVADAERVSIDVADGPLPVRLGLSLVVRDGLAEGPRLESPSHPITVEKEGSGGERGVRIGFAEPGGVALDRDVVVRWTVALAQVGVALETARPAPVRSEAARGLARTGIDEAAFGLLTVVPPAPWTRPAEVARDLILLLDTSGSMDGTPLDQARRVSQALVDTLGPADQLEMISFGSHPVPWRRGPVAATAAHRAEAQRWLSSLSASGGTEMKDGLLAALDPLRAGAQRQVVLITDGQIGFEEEIVATLLARLPAGSRLHTVGVGSGVNRALTRPAARAGRGVEIVIGLGEDPERAARRLLARTSAPSLVELEVGGDALAGADEGREAVAPSRLPDVFAGAPSRLSLRLRPEGGTLTVRGRTAEGRWERQLRVAPVEEGAGRAAVASLWAREAVEDLEMRRLAGEPARPLDGAIERIGLLHAISTRLTSWVAVDDVVSVDPNAPSRREVVPQQLPYGQSMEGLGLRAPSGPTYAMSMQMPESVSLALQRTASAKGAAAWDTASFDMLLDDAEEAELDGALFEGAAGIGAPAPAAPAEPRPPASPARYLRPRVPSPGAPPPSAGSAGPSRPRSQAAETARKKSEAKSEGKSRSANPRRVAGRIFRFAPLPSGVELVVEIDVPETMHFELPAGLSLRLGDGTAVDVMVIPERSTRPGALDAGQVVRLTLQVAMAIDRSALAALIVEFAGGVVWEVTLRS